MSVCAPPLYLTLLQPNYYSVKLIFSFALSYPLAGLLKRVPDGRPDLKNFFIIG
jgi:lysophospholipid acyltransferase